MKQQLLILVFALFWGLASGQNQKALTHKITEDYDDDTDTYTEVLKEAFSYYPNGKLSEREFSVLGISEWTASVKYSYKYNKNNGYLEETIQSNRVGMTDTYMNTEREVITYEGDNMKEQTTYNRVNNEWKPDDNTVFTYEGNVLKSFKTYEWEDSKWELDGRGTIKHNDQQKIIEIVVEELENGNWVFEDKTTFVRDPSTGRVSDVILETWDGVWLKDDKNSYTLDTKGNRLIEISSESVDGTTWMEDDKIEYNYDFNILMSQYNNPYNLNAHLHGLGVEETPHLNKVTSSVESDYENLDFLRRGDDSWEVESRTIYYYSDDTMGLKDLSDSDFISIYPNPVKSALNLKLKEAVQAKVSLYDINGRLVMDQYLQPLNTFLNMESLNSGLYMLKVTTEMGYVNKRITKY